MPVAGEHVGGCGTPPPRRAIHGVGTSGPTQQRAGEAGGRPSVGKTSTAFRTR